MIAKVLDFLRSVQDALHFSEVKADPGGNANKNYQLFAPSGDDSPPLPGDDVITVPSAGRGVSAAVGVNDPKNAGTALPGEVHRVGRSESGSIVGHFWIRRDGTVELSNDGGSITLSPAGVARVQAITEVHLDSPLVKLTDAAGKDVARVGDLVAVRVPALTSATGGPVTPLPPITPTPSGAIPATGQIISGQPKAQA